MKRVQLLLITAVAATVVGVVAVTAGHGGSPGDRTIRLVEKGGSFTFVDNAPTGNAYSKLISAGDFSAGRVQLDNDAGKQVGSLNIVCVATVSGKEVHARFQCNGTVNLADGALAISALDERHADQDVSHISVVGGTGAYEGASGSATESETGGGAELTVRLLP